MDTDTDWIDEFNKKEEVYDIFYKKKIHAVRIIFLYINEKNELISSKKFKYKVENECIGKNKLITLLKHNILYNNRKFFPTYLLQFNINLEPRDIHIYNKTPCKFNFLKQVSYMDSIQWEQTIDFFHSLNRLYIFMKNRPTNNKSSTKKIYISHKQRKKTRRKYI